MASLPTDLLGTSSRSGMFKEGVYSEGCRPLLVLAVFFQQVAIARFPVSKCLDLPLLYRKAFDHSPSLSQYTTERSFRADFPA